jgi:hypothetical protein
MNEAETRAEHKLVALQKSLLLPNLISRKLIVAEIAKAFAESEFEKYWIAQDRLFESDFYRHIKKITLSETDSKQIK